MGGMRLAVVLLPLLLLTSPATGDELRDLRKAFRPTKDPEQAYPARLAALEGVASLDFERLATALLDAARQIEREAVPLEENRLTFLARGGGKPAHRFRRDLDPLHELLDRIDQKLATLTDPEAVEALVSRALEDRKLPLTTRLGAAGRAARLTPEAAAELVEGLAKPRKSPEDVLVVLASAQALGARAAELGPALVRYLEHREAVVCLAAARALAECASPAAIEPLIDRLAAEPPGRARGQYGAALQRLTGVQIGASPGSWRDWLEQEGGPYLRGEKPLSRGKIVPPRRRFAGNTYHGIALDGEAILFVLDRSKSMHKRMAARNDPQGGDETRLQRAQDELIRTLGRLDPSRRFNVITFAATCKRFEGEMVPATPENVDAAQEWVREIELQLQTHVYDALHLGFHIAGRGAQDVFYPASVDTLFLLTDGQPIVAGKADSKPRILADTERWNLLDQVRINVIGLGDNLPRRFLRDLAIQNGGEFVHEKSEDQGGGRP